MFCRHTLLFYTTLLGIAIVRGFDSVSLTQFALHHARKTAPISQALIIAFNIAASVLHLHFESRFTLFCP